MPHVVPAPDELTLPSTYKSVGMDTVVEVEDVAEAAVQPFVLV